MGEVCEIEATVPTGFESTAKEEAIEKLHLNIKSDRGKVIFNIPVADVEKIKELRSIDNTYVVLKRYKKFQFSESLADALASIITIVPEIDWQHGLSVWRRFITCGVAVSGTPVSDWETRLQRARERVQETHGVKTDAPTAGPEACDTAKNEQKTPEEPSAKRPRLEHNAEMPSFRATCYRTGKGHVFQSPQAASIFGGAVQDYFQWNVKMKEFDIEVVLNIEESDVSVSLALTKESMHRRHITRFGPTTLRPTIAYGMLRLCKIQNGDVVCDPMCGGGSIPIEAALNWPSARHLCGDMEEKAVTRTQANVLGVNGRRAEDGLTPISMCVSRWDTTQLPLKDSSVDVFVSDMPFGKRSGSKMRNWHLYPRTLAELARVSARGTGRACLLTQDKKCMLKSLSSLKSYWALVNTVMINIGGLSAGVYILHRSHEIFKAAAKSESKSGPAGESGARNGESQETKIADS